VALSVLCISVLGPAAGGLAALVVGPAAAWGVARLQRRPAGTAPDPALALALDLVAESMRAGQPLASALLLAAPAAGGTVAGRLGRVAGLLRLGADPEQAWALVAGDPVLAPVAAGACRSASSGIRLARTFERLAEEVREQRRAAAQARAHRAGVLAMAPLGLCFLPAFVCLGVVPTVAGIAADVLPGLLSGGSTGTP
jgi:Flp pilus assembly protein TadB